MREIKNPKIFMYNTMDETIYIYGLSNFQFSEDDTYFIHVDNKRLKRLNKRYIKLKPLMYLYQEISDNPWAINKLPYKKGVFPNFLVAIKFQIISTHYSLSKVTSLSRLKGFSRVIDDNRYFARIPLVNEIDHIDNGILIGITHSLTYDLPQDYIELEDGRAVLEDWTVKDIVIKQYFTDQRTKIFSGEDGHTHL